MRGICNGPVQCSLFDVRAIALSGIMVLVDDDANSPNHSDFLMSDTRVFRVMYDYYGSAHPRESL